MAVSLSSRQLSSPDGGRKGPSLSACLSPPQPGDPAESAVSPLAARRTPPQFYLSPQQLQLMQYLQSQSQLSPQQQLQLGQLQQQYR